MKKNRLHLVGFLVAIFAAIAVVFFFVKNRQTSPEVQTDKSVSLRELPHSVGSLPVWFSSRTKHAISDVATRRSAPTNTTITTGSIRSDISTGISLSESSLSVSSIPAWITTRTKHRSKPFAYEMTNSLNLSQNSMVRVDGNYDMQVLRDVRKKSQDPAIYKVLLLRLHSEHAYDEVVDLLSGHRSLWDEGSPDMYIRSLRESSVISGTQDIGYMQKELQNLLSSQLISQSEYDSYSLLLNTWTGNIDGLVAGLGVLSDVNLRTGLQKFIDYYNGQKDVPIYYRNALIAMVLAEYEYFSLAEEILKPILKDNPKYLLPKQILAHITFMTRGWDAAQLHLKELITLDPDQVDLYRFFRGIVAYQIGEYDRAILFFRQVEDPSYLPDVSRYLVLAYDHLDDEKNRDESFDSLLQYALEPGDFYTYFYMTLFRPFQNGKWEPDATPKSDLALLKKYIKRCTETLKDDAYVVCQYGAVGSLFAHGKFDDASKSLISLYRQYPVGYVARALGDYYMYKDDKRNATRYYYLALRKAASPEEQLVTQQKLLDLRDDVSK